jgi:hypothetical protein
MVSHFGNDTVFMDVAGIAPGRDFRKVIDEHVATCGVLLAVIGKTWLTAQNATGQRRLDDPTDFVRLETASALKRDIPVIPVLVQGASMPQAAQLPPDLAELAFRNGVELSHARWDSDIQLLIKALESYVEAGRIGSESDGDHAAARVVGPVQLDKADGGSAVTQQRARRPYMAIAVAVATAAVVSLGAYTWYEVQARQSAQKRTITPDLDRKEVVKEPEVHGSAVQEAEKKVADKREANGLAASKAAAEKAEIKRAEKEKAAAEKVAAEKAEKERAEKERAEKEKVAAERVAAEKVAADAEAAESAAATQRARWPSYNFPPPNGGSVVFTIMPDGNPACASYDAAICLWGVSYEKIDFARLRPLVCGQMHRARWGVTGYEDPKHWCNLAKKIRYNRRETKYKH